MKIEIIYRSPFKDVSIGSNDGLYQLRQKIFNFIYASSTLIQRVLATFSSIKDEDRFYIHSNR